MIAEALLSWLWAVIEVLWLTEDNRGALRYDICLHGADTHRVMCWGGVQVQAKDGDITNEKAWSKKPQILLLRHGL